MDKGEQKKPLLLGAFLPMYEVSYVQRTARVTNGARGIERGKHLGVFPYYPL